MEDRSVLIDSRTWEESPYRVGSTLSEEQLEQLLALSRRNRAREKALYLLSRRDHSQKELERKLCRSCRDLQQQEAAAVVQRLQEIGVVNDPAYARRLARDLRLRRHFSRRFTFMELCRRGIDRETAEAAVAETDSLTSDVEQALALLQKKRYNDLQHIDTQNKAKAMLTRRGFDLSDIREALARYCEDLSQDLSNDVYPEDAFSEASCPEDFYPEWDDTDE